MNYQADYHELVSIDYDEAYIHYELIEKDLGERFAKCVREKMNKVLANPEHYGEKTFKGYRESKVEGFPYVIVYRVYKRKKIVFVSSIHHTKKHPSKKFRK